MLETWTRLLALLELAVAASLVRCELSGRLEVGARTIRRDIERLRRLGRPVDATPDFEIVEPPELIATVRRLAVRFAAATSTFAPPQTPPDP